MFSIVRSLDLEYGCSYICGEQSERRIFCREQQHCWGSILGRPTAASSPASPLLPLPRAFCAPDGRESHRLALVPGWQCDMQGGLVPRSLHPSAWSPPPANRLNAFRHFPHLLSCGFCCVLHRVPPFGMGDGGWGRSLQWLKGSE